jgi:hypothetical protein
MYVCMYVHTYVCVYVCICVYVCMYVLCVYVGTMCVCMYVCVCVYVCMYVRVCVCMYVFISYLTHATLSYHLIGLNWIAQLTLGEGKNNEDLINSVIIRESHKSPVRCEILGKPHTCCCYW